MDLLFFRFSNSVIFIIGYYSSSIQYIIELFLFRIAKAMRDSETLSLSATTGSAENRNRKTVVRIQSKLL